MSRLVEAARDRYRKFHGRRAESDDVVDLPLESLEVLTFLGEAVSISYRAAKDNDDRTDGEPVVYTHDFEGPVNVACDPDGGVLVLWGPGLRVGEWIE